MEAIPDKAPQRSRWLRFTIRDLLWITVVAAVACGWWNEVRKREQAVRELGKHRLEMYVRIAAERARYVRSKEPAILLPVKTATPPNLPSN